jgi:hypothetical protein
LSGLAVIRSKSFGRRGRIRQIDAVGVRRRLMARRGVDRRQTGDLPRQRKRRRCEEWAKGSRQQKNPCCQSKGSVAICRHLAQDDASSGGGIRTPDTRIMILRAGFDKGLQSNGLGELNSGCCTHRCTQLELSPELAQVVTAWPLLTPEQRQALSLTATSFLH